MEASKLHVIGLWEGEFTGDWWFPRTKGQQSGKCFHLMRSPWVLLLQNPGHMAADFSTPCIAQTSAVISLNIQSKQVLVVHYGDVIMGAIASQINSLAIVYSTVYSDAHQRKHQSSASLAFVWGNHQGPVNSPHKWPVTWKMFPFDDVIITTEGHAVSYVPMSMVCSNSNEACLVNGCATWFTFWRSRD